MVQSTYPTISAKQVHKAWTTMSKTLWKKNIEPLPSVRALLSNLKDNVDILNLPEMEGIKQVAWVMKKIVSPLQGKIIKVGIDATYNTNSMHLELYTILGEHDNAGFPLSYCLLTMASSVEDRKCTRALEVWAAVLCDKYSLNLRFVHTDKDMAEIGATCISEHLLQLQMQNTNCVGGISMKWLVYDPLRARHKYGFIDLTFRPYGHSDPNDSKGKAPGEPRFSAHGGLPLTSSSPKSCRTPMHLDRSAQDTENNVGPSPPTGGNPNPGCVPMHLAGGSQDAENDTAGGRQEAGVELTASSKLTIQIPTSWRYHRAESIAKDELDEETTVGAWECTTQHFGRNG
ncbi:hypothetical protein EDB92DRAFT_1813615 [Lactarius akahatsu]|uniref:Uncharacterized protein n=1 Tax=Lactarius akahatsu TaxID=416441 RepID=A0AAD4LRP1_9AGAM|nr:hypothetical protein EDB92DRAFT_1813615 [Lactarius akahatsu]